MATATKSPPRLTELEAAEREVEQAAARAEAARQRAVAAAEAARLRQAERQRQWADIEVGNHVDRIQEHAKAVGAARTTFESAAVDDPTTAISAFVAWTKTLADQHAAGGSYDMAMSILGRTARLNEWPRLSFSAELDGVLEANAGEQMDAAIAPEQERRRIAFDGQETS